MIGELKETIDCFLDGCDGEWRTHDMAEHVFESMPHMVSELVWDGIQANSIFGAYSIGMIGGEWRAYLRGSKVVGEGVAYDFDSAKAAAKQAVDIHYRSTVMSAFETNSTVKEQADG